LPLPREAVPLLRQGLVTGVSGRNWASYGDSVILPADLPDWRRNLLTDPQTPGGLLVACAAERVDTILQQILAASYSAHAPHRPDRSRRALRPYRGVSGRASGVGAIAPPLNFPPFTRRPATPFACERSILMGSCRRTTRLSTAGCAHLFA